MNTRTIVERGWNQISGIVTALDDLDDAINGHGLSGEEQQLVVRKKFDRLRDRTRTFEKTYTDIDANVDQESPLVNAYKNIKNALLTVGKVGGGAAILWTFIKHVLMAE